MFNGRMYSGCPDCGVFQRRGNPGQQSRTDRTRTGAYRDSVGRRNSFNAGRDDCQRISYNAHRGTDNISGVGAGVFSETAAAIGCGIHIGGSTGNAVICRETHTDNRSAVCANINTNIDAKINTDTGAETGADANDEQNTGANYGSNAEYQTDIRTDRTDHGKADTAELYDFDFL